MKLKATYTVRELADATGRTRQQVHRILAANEVALIRAGRAAYAPLSEIRQKVPELWESLLTVATLEAAAKAGRTRAA